MFLHSDRPVPIASEDENDIRREGVNIALDEKAIQPHRGQQEKLG